MIKKLKKTLKSSPKSHQQPLSNHHNSNIKINNCINNNNHRHPPPHHHQKKANNNNIHHLQSSNHFNHTINSYHCLTTSSVKRESLPSSPSSSTEEKIDLTSPHHLKDKNTSPDIRIDLIKERISILEAVTCEEKEEDREEGENKSQLNVTLNLEVSPEEEDERPEAENITPPVHHSSSSQQNFLENNKRLNEEQKDSSSATTQPKSEGIGFRKITESEATSGGYYSNSDSKSRDETQIYQKENLVQKLEVQNAIKKEKKEEDHKKNIRSENNSNNLNQVC